jgi:(2R)-ethylmalonyl-CoA mutase
LTKKEIRPTTFSKSSGATWPDSRTVSSTAIAVLDEVKGAGQVSDDDFEKVVGRISFFVNAGVRFVEETCKMRAFVQLWDEITRERSGVTDEKMRRFRYGVQVNSLGLTEAQPENNVQRIVLEMLGVTLSKNARARALQLPAWNEAMGLPRPWDQQWSLRIQQVLANETDLLEYPDIFEGSKVMDGLVDELAEGARAEMAVVEEHGGAVSAVPYMKARLVESHRERVARIESGEQKVIGQNSFTETEDSPLTAGADGGILTPDPEVERERVEALEAWKAERDEEAVRAALDELGRVAADESQNIRPATLAAAKPGATTGEWAGVLREAFGAYRAPTGVDGAAPPGDREELEAIRGRVDEV